MLERGLRANDQSANGMAGESLNIEGRRANTSAIPPSRNGRKRSNTIAPPAAVAAGIANASRLLKPSPNALLEM